MRAVQLIMRIGCAGSMLEPIDDGDDHGAQDNPEELVPVEERHAGQVGSTLL